MRPSYIEAHLNRGDILLRMNRSNEALAQYQTALRFEPNNADILYNVIEQIYVIVRLFFSNIFFCITLRLELFTWSRRGK